MILEGTADKVGRSEKYGFLNGVTTPGNDQICISVTDHDFSLPVCEEYPHVVLIWVINKASVS